MKQIRRDQIDDLPLPLLVRSYLNTPFYYSEELVNLQNSLEKHDDDRNDLFMSANLKQMVDSILIDDSVIVQKYGCQLVSARTKQAHDDNIHHKPLIIPKS